MLAAVQAWYRPRSGRRVVSLGACRNLAKTEPGLVFYEAFVDHRQPAQDLLELCRRVQFPPLRR
jgi:hypothetical protein